MSTEVRKPKVGDTVTNHDGRGWRIIEIGKGNVHLELLYNKEWVRMDRLSRLQGFLFDWMYN